MPLAYNYNPMHFSSGNMIFGLILVVFYLYCGWKLFEKARQPGWAAIIPLYNFIVLMKIIGKPWWWLLLMIIPFVNFVMIIIIYHNLALRFGKGTGFTVGLVFLSGIFMPILALGSAKYVPPPKV